MYKEFNIYGPYKRNDGRMHVILINGPIRKTLSYPKYLVELSIGRQLLETETVHHVDGDFTNNEIENLQILNKDEHSRLHATIYQDENICNCVECGDEIILNRKQQRTLKQNRNRGKAGPFCSKKCSGIYGTKIQYMSAA